MSVKSVSENPVFDFSNAPDTKLSLNVNTRNHFNKKFTPYPHQSECLEELDAFLSDPNYRIMIEKISTAGGKTALALAPAKAWIEAGGKTVIIAPNKEIQKQFGDEADNDVSIVTGASDFMCSTFPKSSCASVVARKGCSFRRFTDFDGNIISSTMCDCPYRKKQLEAVERAKVKPLCFTSHSYMAFRNNPLFAPALPKGDGLMIVDEAHLLADQLASFLSLSLKVSFINLLVGHTGEKGDNFRDLFFSSSFNKNHEGLDLIPLKENQNFYLSSLKKILEVRIEEWEILVKNQDEETMDEMIPGLSDLKDRDKYIKYLDMLSDINSRLELILSLVDETQWACELTTSINNSMDYLIPIKERKELYFTIRPGKIPLSYLKQFFSGFSKIILMSGTLFKTHYQRLGLVSDANITEDGKIVGALDFEAESSIPPERRMMYIDTVHGHSCNYKNLDETFSQFAKFIVHKLCKKLPGEKGMIHVASTYQAEKLARFCNLEALKLHKRKRSLGKDDKGPIAKFVTPEKLGWEKTFSGFQKAKVGGKYGENLFLIAARRYEGLNLKDDTCRINIIAKAPFLNMKDSIVISLDHIFKVYSVVSTLTSFIQAGNRAVRHPKDWALNICLDLAMKPMLQKYYNDLPKYTRDALQEANDLNWLNNWKIPTDKKKKGIFGE